MKASISLSDGRIIIITSDKGIYNKITYDCFFENNVKVTDGETVVFSENLNISLAPFIADPARVLIMPADRAFTLIPLSPKSVAKYLTEDSNAALATPITL